MTNIGDISIDQLSTQLNELETHFDKPVKLKLNKPITDKIIKKGLKTVKATTPLMEQEFIKYNVTFRIIENNYHLDLFEFNIVEENQGL